MVAAAFFDLDKTIIAKSSTLAFSRSLYRAGMLDAPTLAKAGIAQAYFQAFGADHEKLKRVKDELGSLTTGWSRERVVELIEETVEKVVEPLVYAEALAIIAGHRARGRRVVVVSASPEEIVRPLCAYLGIEDIIATRAEVDDEGRYTGRLERFIYGEGKADAIAAAAAAQGIDLESSYAYSDSVTDVPMLESVGHPVVVNPDAALAAHAETQGWEVRHFRLAVTLRDRMAAKAMPGAAVATGVAAILAYWALRTRRA